MKDLILFSEVLLRNPGNKSYEILKVIKESTDTQEKKKLRRAWYRVYARAKDRVTDLQFKTIICFTDNYGVIILGEIKVQQLMSMKNQSKTNSTLFKFLSLFSFRQRLPMKSELMNTTTVITQGESYTMLAYVKCGVLKKDAGDADVYMCSRCDFTMGRDISGAANILLRCASEVSQRTETVSGKKRKSA